MREKNIKVQITLPKEIVDEIEHEMKQNYLTRSAWFLKVAKDALDRKRKKKTIELDI